MRNMARLSQVSALKRNEIKALVEGVWQSRNTRTTEDTPRISKKEFFLTAAREFGEPKPAVEKKPEEMTLAEINAIRYGAKS